MRKIGVLAFYQERGTRATTHIPKEIADDLVRRLVCERISSKLIRMLPPESACMAQRHIPMHTHRQANIQTHAIAAGPLPPVEIGGVKFIDPNPERRWSAILAHWRAGELQLAHALEDSARQGRHEAADVMPTHTNGASLADNRDQAPAAAGLVLPAEVQPRAV